jgi:carboxyl-terminal processing protease
MKHLIKSVTVFASIFLLAQGVFCDDLLSRRLANFDRTFNKAKEKYSSKYDIEDKVFQKIYDTYRPQMTLETTRAEWQSIRMKISGDMEKHVITRDIPGFSDLSEPEKNFELLWKAFDLKYALFDVKNINWRAIYKVYRPQVTANTNDDELSNVLTSMMGHLNDSHVRLSYNSQVFDAGFINCYIEEYGQEKFFERMKTGKPMPESYFIKEPETANNGWVTYGWIANNVGYIHMQLIRDYLDIIDVIINEFKKAQGIVIDLRCNGGGGLGQQLAGRFADQKRLYMVLKNRIGPGYSDFDDPESFYVEPMGPIQFTKNIIVLADRTSFSGAEDFALALRVLPHVTIVGETTSGHLGDAMSLCLMNNWVCTITTCLIVDQNGFCWEGIGIRPDIRQLNSEEDIKNGKDRLTELAIKLIQSGELKPHKGRALEKVH